jgi:hypothetical protein
LVSIPDRVPIVARICSATRPCPAAGLVLDLVPDELLAVPVVAAVGSVPATRHRETEKSGGRVYLGNLV